MRFDEAGVLGWSVWDESSAHCHLTMAARIANVPASPLTQVHLRPFVQVPG